MKERRYYPDFLLKVNNKKNDVIVWLVEVKPYKECKPPINSKKKSKKTLLYEQKT